MSRTLLARGLVCGLLLLVAGCVMPTATNPQSPEPPPPIPGHKPKPVS